VCVCVCVCARELKSSVPGGRGDSVSSGELGVDKGEAHELVLVQVLNHFLVGGGQHRRVAGEKTVKVLGVPATLLRRRRRKEGEGGVHRGGEGWGGVGMERNGWFGEGGGTKEGQWWVEPGCEMTQRGHGFKYLNEEPALDSAPSVIGPKGNGLVTFRAIQQTESTNQARLTHTPPPPTPFSNI